MGWGWVTKVQRQKKDGSAKGMDTFVPFSDWFSFTDPISCISCSLECVLCSDPWNAIQGECAHLMCLNTGAGASTVIYKEPKDGNYHHVQMTLLECLACVRAGEPSQYMCVFSTLGKIFCCTFYLWL